MTNRFSPNTLGATYMMLSMAGFILNDTLMKLALTDIGLFQAILIRGVFASVFMGLLCWRMGGLQTENGIINTLKHPTVILRTLGETGGTFFFLSALFQMPIANVTAVLQVLPLTITLGAALLFGEKVGWRRYLAIIVGLLGVLLIIKPGSEGFNIYALYALTATLFITVRDLATRRMPSTTPSLLVSFITAIVIMGMGAVGSMIQPWQEVSSNALIYLVGAASVIIFGYLFSVTAMRHGDVSFVSPFRYSILIWALLLGLFIFGDIPDRWSMLGACIVVGSGLYTFSRERIQDRSVDENKPSVFD